MGAKYAVAVANGTAALHMLCYAAGIKEGDEVLVPAMTFAASANCVLCCKGTPVFVDIDPQTYNIDLAKIEEKITSKTKAIIPVDFTGQSVDMTALKQIADKHNLIIIEDAAHALGSEYNGEKVGTSQINRLDEFINRQREIVKVYTEAFSSIEEIVTPYEAQYSNSGWHIYVIKLELEKLRGTRKEIFDALQKENIGVNVHYLPVYLHPYYEALGYKRGLCPIAEELYEGIITLPLFPRMNNKDIDDVINGVKKVINYYKKL